VTATFLAVATDEPALGPSSRTANKGKSVLNRCLTPSEFGRRYRLSPDRVRDMIRAGTLGALNVNSSAVGRPRFRITPQHMREFEERYQFRPAVKTKPRRRRNEIKDYFPELD
jgi:hypothetical protein